MATITCNKTDCKFIHTKGTRKTTPTPPPPKKSLNQAGGGKGQSYAQVTANSYYNVAFLSYSLEFDHLVLFRFAFAFTRHLSDNKRIKYFQLSRHHPVFLPRTSRSFYNQILWKTRPSSQQIKFLEFSSSQLEFVLVSINLGNEVVVIIAANRIPRNTRPSSQQIEFWDFSPSPRKRQP